MASDVLRFTDRGIYCPAGDFFIDPWRPVARALITHGHADHARPGHDAYLCTTAAAPVLRHRLGKIRLDSIGYGVARRIGAATVSFHPAGHVPGSAQIRVESSGQIWVVSGDYKTEADGLSEPFEPVRCHVYISECTFGLPVFRWPSQTDLAGQVNGWWAANAAAGRVSLLGAYALGKAQRLMATVDSSIGPILTHGAVEATNAVLRAQGLPLPATVPVTPDTRAADHPGALVIAPPSALGSAWARRFGDASTAFASGWMRLRGVRRRRGVDRGFVVSDHADWDGLNAAIAATGAERVFVTHGYTTAFRQWLESQGYDAGIVQTEYEGEASEDVSSADAATEDAP
jgi:putative mRNA 3-end processing factor